MWNPWKHLRLAGALVIVAGALFNHTLVTFMGLIIQYIGVIGGVDLVERKVDALFEHLNAQENQETK